MSAGQRCRLGEEELGQEDAVAAVIAEAILGHAEQEVVRPVAKDVRVEAVCGATRMQKAANLPPPLYEVDHPGDCPGEVEQHGKGAAHEGTRQQCTADSSSSSWMTVHRDAAVSTMCRHFWQTCEAGTREAPPPRKPKVWRGGGCWLMGRSSLRRILTCCRTPSSRVLFLRVGDWSWCLE